MKDYTLKNTKDYVLSDDQNEIVDALVNNDFYFNCAQTGFGKTFTTITAAVHKMLERKEDNIHFIIVAPQSAVKAFRDTIKGLLRLSLNTYTASSTRVFKGARFHLFNYSTLTENIFVNDFTGIIGTNKRFQQLKDLVLKHKNTWLICDEIHALQDLNTQQYKVMKAIMPWFTGAWGLTATPILNNIMGFYNMVEIIKPGFLASNEFHFKNKYCTFNDSGYWTKSFGNPVFKKTKELSGYKNLDVLQDRFNKISIIKSKHYDIDFIFDEAKLSKATKQYYRFAADGLFSGKVLKSGKLKKSKQNHSAARLHDLQRVVSNSHAKFKLLKDKGKLTEKEVLLINTIKEVIARDEAVLIYFGYHETIDRIKYILGRLKAKLEIPNIHEVTGKIDQAKRKKVEDAIKPRDVVLITSAGTESINLQKANNIIFYEVPFPIREFIQATGRITRTNTKFSKFRAYILEATGTIDTYKKMRLQSNMTLVKAVLGGSNTLPVELLILSEKDKQDMKKTYLWWK